MAEDDVASSLIAALSNEGEYVDDGRFTLDAAKAQAKLRDYQLSDPHGYLLLLIEAAWLATRGRRAGSRARIEIETGSKTTVVFDSPSFPRDVLGNLFAAALGDSTGLEGGTQRARVLQLLGLAANSALALEPRGLSIEAVDPDGQVIRAEITTDEVTVEALDRDPVPVPEVRFVLRGARIDLDRPESERALVRERCRLSTLEVRVDGERVSKGPRADIDEDEGPAGPVLLDDVEIGVVGYTPGFDPAKARIINRGVEVETLHIRAPKGLIAVVEVDLPMDLSRSQIQRGEAFDAVEAAITTAMEARPRTRSRASWGAIDTGDGRMFLVLGLLGGGFLVLIGLLFWSVIMLAEGS